MIETWVPLLGGLIFVLLSSLPTGFVPEEDKGAYFVDVQLPDGATLERTSEVLDEVREILMADPDVAHVITVSGFSILKGVAAPNGALGIAVLKDWDERPDPGQHQRAIANRAQMQLLAIPDAMVMVFAPPALPGIGAVGGRGPGLLG